MFLWQQILFIRIASFLGEWPRSTASVQRLSEAYEACSLSKAALLFLPVLFTGLLKQTCSEFLSLDWLFIGLLSPSCFRLTWLMQFLFLKSLLELFLKHFLCVCSESDQIGHTGLVLSALTQRRDSQNDTYRDYWPFLTQVKRWVIIKHFFMFFLIAFSPETICVCKWWLLKIVLSVGRLTAFASESKNLLVFCGFGWIVLEEQIDMNLNWYEIEILMYSFSPYWTFIYFSFSSCDFLLSFFLVVARGVYFFLVFFFFFLLLLPSYILFLW